MQHTKLKRLVRALKVPQYAAVGILESLWHLTAREAPEGNIGKLSNEDIAAWIDWDGTADSLIEGLVSAGWLDEVTEYRLVVHDWMEHADESVKKVLQRKGVDTSRPTGQQIYFIRATVRGLIKIGITEGDLQSRLTNLQVGSTEKLELLGAIDGNRKTEGELHKRFAGCREMGEWFRPTVALLEYIASAVGCRIPPLASVGVLPEPLPVPVPEPKTTAKTTAIAVIELPAWLDREVWNAYLEMRKKKRAVPTDRALKGILTQLGIFRNKGHNPNAILDTSIRSNWTDVYEPKTGASNGNRNYSKTGGNVTAAIGALAILEQAERNSSLADEMQSEAGSGGEPGDLSHLRAGSIQL